MDNPAALTTPPPPQEGPEKARSFRTFWRWLASLDLTNPPAPILRWLGVLLVGIVYVAMGSPSPLGDWLWFAIIGGSLIFPDVAGFGVAGVRLDLKKTQDELNAVKLRLDLRQLQVSGGLHLHGEEAGRLFGRAFLASIGEQAAKNEQFTLVDDDVAEDVTS